MTSHPFFLCKSLCSIVIVTRHAPGPFDVSLASEGSNRGRMSRAELARCPSQQVRVPPEGRCVYMLQAQGNDARYTHLLGGTAYQGGQTRALPRACCRF